MQANEQKNDSNSKDVPKPENVDHIHELQEQIADLKKRWPAHSPLPSMLQHLDDLEDELENELSKQTR
jgi:hypothetical protein